VLESVAVGPVSAGVNQFVFQAPAPDAGRIPAGDLLGVTVVLLTCAYRGQEFVRIGYYVNNSYATPELNAAPPSPPRVAEIDRNILADKPRITLFSIDWTPPGQQPLQVQQGPAQAQQQQQQQQQQPPQATVAPLQPQQPVMEVSQAVTAMEVSAQVPSDTPMIL
jgi:histone chaperone ASF1